MGKARILVVEDEAIVAMDLQYKLEDLGYSVTGGTAGPPHPPLPYHRVSRRLFSVQREPAQRGEGPFVTASDPAPLA